MPKSGQLSRRERKGRNKCLVVAAWLPEMSAAKMLARTVEGPTASVAGLSQVAWPASC